MTPCRSGGEFGRARQAFGISNCKSQMAARLKSVICDSSRSEDRGPLPRSEELASRWLLNMRNSR